jgi:hypothetical protein
MFVLDTNILSAMMSEEEATRREIRTVLTLFPNPLWPLCDALFSPDN